MRKGTNPYPTGPKPPAPPNPPPVRRVCEECGMIQTCERHTSWLCRLLEWSKL